MESNVSNRLRSAMDDMNINAAELVRRSGVSKNSISQYLHGKNVPNTKSASLLGKALNVEPLWLMGFDVPKTGIPKQTDAAPVYSKCALPEIPPYDGIFPIAVKRLPVLGYVSCGNPIFMNEEREVYVEVGTNINAHFILIARGDSMINARIHEGDLVFIQSTPQVENGQIAVVAIGDEATLKRFYYYPETQQICLQSENPAYAPMIFTGQQLEDIRVLGRAIAFQSDVR